MPDHYSDTDIDIDFQDRDKALEGLKYVPACRIISDGKLHPHNVGVYFQNIPCDPVSGLASIVYKEAVMRGYFKIDFLNASLYEGIRNEQHLDSLIEQEPIWDLLQDKWFVSQLWHLHDHADLVVKMQPTSVEQLAMVLAVIRPAKRHLADKLWDEIEETVWDKPEPGDQGYQYKASFFKRPHAIAYSIGICVQMNLMVEQTQE